MATTRTPRKGKGSARTDRAKRPQRKRFPVLPLALALVAALAIVAIAVNRGGSDDGDDNGGSGSAQIEQNREVQLSGIALADFTKTENDPAVGAAAPVVKGQTFDGKSMTIGGAGEPQLVFFLAHWCPHCQKEVPVVTKWLEESGEPDGIALKAVSTGVDRARPNYPPSDWLEEERWPIDTLADDQSVSTGQAYGLTGYPFFVAIDAEGKVAARASGELTVPQIEALISAAKG